jgi:hypothetical protein
LSTIATSAGQYLFVQKAYDHVDLMRTGAALKEPTTPELELAVEEALKQMKATMEIK